jgi:hypothetical protein
MVSQKERSRHVHNQVFSQRPQSRIDPIDAAGVTEVCKPVDLLGRRADAARQLRGANILVQHLIEQEYLGRNAGA